MVISQFDPEEEARLIAGFYKEMSALKPFIEWFKGYVQKKDDADFILHALSSHPWQSSALHFNRYESDFDI